MTLDSSCRELDEIAGLLVREHELIRLMRSRGESPCVCDEARAHAGGISQVALLLMPLALEALDLETAAAYVA